MNTATSTISDGMTATVEQARNGDTGAFARIVRQYQSLVSGVLFSATGDFHKSEDFTQETFLIAWRNLGELRDSENIAAWLCTIARNLAHRSQRKPSLSTEELDELTNEKASPEPEPDTELLRREQSEMVWSALGEIDEKYRETLVLYYRSGKSVREIAAAMDSTEDAVNQRLVRARKSLKVKLEQMIGDVLTDTAPGEAFTFGIIAAITTGSMALTTQTAVAATTGTATGSGVIGKGIGVVGVGLVAWIVGIIWIGLVSIVVPLIGLFGGFNALIASTRNAPTVRSRRLMIRGGMSSVGIAMFLMGAYFFAVALPASLMSFGTKGAVITVLAYFFFCNIIFRALWINARWRKTIEEDLGRRPAPDVPLEQSWLSQRTLRWTFGASLFAFCLGLSGFMFFIWQMSNEIHSVALQRTVFYGFLSVQLLPVGLFIYVYRRTMHMATEDGLKKYPPPIPDILDVVLGKKEMPPEKTTFRARIGSDMIGMGTLILIGSVQPVMLGLRQPNPWPGYLAIGVSLLGFVLFSVFVAGKPKVRHLGWMLTAWLFTAFYGWVLWGSTFRQQFNEMPSEELATLFIYVLFFFAGVAGFCGYIGLFEKEVNRKLGVTKE